MNNKNTTRNALRTSVLAFLLCFALLVGTTFAWFTDSAIVNVNTIQAGNLDIALEQYDAATNAWVSAELGTVSFMTADGTAVTLWEPGASYLLPKFRVVNNGNLAAKFMVQVAGINGDAELNEAITWTAAPVDANGNVGEYGGLTAFCASEYPLNPGDSYAFQIQGTMNTTAGNEYKDLTIDDISVTIVATQYSGVETDINGATYDANAEYPDVAYVSTPDELRAALTSVPDGATIYMTEGTYDITAQIDINGKSVNIIGLGDVTIRLPDTSTAKIFYIYGSNGDEGVNVRLSNLKLEAPKSKGAIWLRTNSSMCTPGNLNLTLDNVTVPSIQTDNNYDNNITFNVKLKNSIVTNWVHLEANVMAETNKDTYTNFEYDETSVVNGLMVQSSVKDAAIAHITINGVVPTVKGEVIPY